MSFSVTGFGAQQLQPSPQVFQALSLGGNPPVPPAPPYGTPNQNLVPVQRTGTPAIPANLTVAAQPVFEALRRVNPTIVAHVNNPVFATQPNTTSTIDANNPAVAHQVQLNTAQTPAAGLNVPQGPVSFTLTQTPAYVTSDAQAFQQTFANIKLPDVTQPAPQTQPAQETQPARSYVPPANASLVGRIVQTVQQLAASAVYPAPVFSFSA